MVTDNTGKCDTLRIPEVCPQSVSVPPAYCIRAAGVLRYNRESDNNSRNLTTILPESQPLTEYPLKCEYCGGNAKPSVDLMWVQGFETAPLFCCARWQQLWETLQRQRCLVKGRSGGTPASPDEDDNPAVEEEEEELLFQVPPTSKVFRFQLSSALERGSWSAVRPAGATEKHFKVKEEEEQVLLPVCDHKTHQFGMCRRHQDGTECRQTYYGNGLKFLTVFADGSAQVFYPSGRLALVVVVTELNGRVCVVYEDSAAPHQPIRAMFQSDGRATCYHSNGNIWLTLNRSGGQCLGEDGARVRRWSWAGLSPTPLQPVFLSLNKAVGVRVLSRERVFVSFLSGGQQAKLSVGSCCAQAECKTGGASSGPSVLKEELFVLAARIRLHLPIQHPHQYLTTPSHPKLMKTTQVQRLHVVARKLLEVSAVVMMSESERDFIQRCLQDFL
uniref:glutamate-rich protein 6 n=1 Tax=Semicossyphus pulcher TaxID=241346 RepID=UPI0037E90176